MEKNARSQKETWKIFGSDEILEDKDLIEYYKLHQLDVKLNYKLLGNFTSEGKYVLPEEIKKTLVGIKKLITHSGENSYLAEAEIKTRSLRFAIKYWTANNKGVANLYFIENIEGEDVQTFVAQYISENDESFLVKVKSVFNLITESSELEDEYLKEIEEKYSALEVKKSERDFVVELQSEFYLYEFLDMLKDQCGEAGKQIANQIEVEIEEKKLLTNKDGMYTAARLKLDKLIVAAGGFNTLKTKMPTLPKALQTYTKPVKDYDDISNRLDAMKPPPSDQTSANKGGASSKNGGAKKSKGKKKSGGEKNKGGKDKKNKKKDGGKDKKKDQVKDLLLGSDIVKKWLNEGIGANKEEKATLSKASVEGVLKDTGEIVALATSVSAEVNKAPVDMKVEKKDATVVNNVRIMSAIDMFGGIVGASERTIKNADIVLTDDHAAKRIEISDGELKGLISYDEKVVVSETFSEKWSATEMGL